jgi:hypothetical protein
MTEYPAAEENAQVAQFDLRGRIVRRWLISVVIFPIRLLPRRFWKRTLVFLTLRIPTTINANTKLDRIDLVSEDLGARIVVMKIRHIGFGTAWSKDLQTFTSVQSYGKT